jgi:hypothetical protein
MANYTWLGNLCGFAGGYTISKGNFDGLVGSLIDGHNLYSGKIFRDSAVAAPVACDFPNNTYMTSAELKDGTYDRYNFSREHDFNILCIPGIDAVSNTDQDQEFYVFYNGECTKPGAAFSQIIESVPDVAASFLFDYKTGCDEEDLFYNISELDINAVGTQTVALLVPARIVEGMQAYIPVSALNMPYNDYTCPVPCVREIEDNLFAAYMNDNTGNAGQLILYEYDFATEAVVQRDSYALGTFIIAGNGDYISVTNSMLEWDELGERLFLGDPLYTGSKPNQGRILVFDVDRTLKTLTFSSYLYPPAPARYGYFGCSLAVDGGPDGTGQLIVGEPGANYIRCFDPITLAELGCSFTVSKGEIGRGVCAYNNIMGYTSADGILPGKITVVYSSYATGVWLTGITGSQISCIGEIINIACSTKFTDPFNGKKTPWISTRHLNQGWYDFSFYTPNYFYSTTTPRSYSNTDIGSRYSFGRFTDASRVYRFDQNTLLHWHDDASYETLIVSPSQTTGYDPSVCIGVVNPLNTDEMRALFFYYGNSAVGYGLYTDIIDVGMGFLPGFAPGNFYLTHTIDVTSWDFMEAVTQVSSTGLDDALRWVVSLDGGVTWKTVQSPGGGWVQLTSFEDGYANGGLMSTLSSDLITLDVNAASSMIIGFMFVSGTDDGLSSPTLSTINITYRDIINDPEFVLNHSTSTYHSKIEHQCYQANTWAYIYAITESPTPVDRCTLVMSKKTSVYTSLYGI